MNKIKYLLFLCAFLGSTGWGPFTNTTESNTASWIAQQTRAINAQASNINPEVLKLSLTAYAAARRRGLDHKQLLTIIDYSKPSTERRLWVVDMRNDRVLFNTWVSHGKNSGQARATSFSNQPGSLKSSIGVFLTENSYIGGNGYSLRLAGLERGINDNALSRDIVVHGAWYADPTNVGRYAQLGRSWGCPAVSPKLARPLIDTIKNNTLVVAYYPDRNWLHNSSFLTVI